MTDVMSDHDAALIRLRAVLLKGSRCYWLWDGTAYVLHGIETEPLTAARIVRLGNLYARATGCLYPQDRRTLANDTAALARLLHGDADALEWEEL